jgi:hypothetical protein
MDGGKARKLGFPVSIRSLILVIAVPALLIVPVAWGVRQSRRTQNAPSRANAAEAAATQAQANAEPARDQVQSLRDDAVRRAARHDPKNDAERVRQLAEEINGLARIQDRVQEDLYRLRARTMKPTSPPTLDALRDPRNAAREPRDESDAGSP